MIAVAKTTKPFRARAIYVLLFAGPHDVRLCRYGDAGFEGLPPPGFDILPATEQSQYVDLTAWLILEP